LRCERTRAFFFVRESKQALPRPATTTRMPMNAADQAIFAISGPAGWCIAG
jgi:hypothetical protein